MIFPIVGTILYIIIGSKLCKNKVLKKINRNMVEMQNYLVQDDNIRKEIEDNGLDKLKYICDFAGFPISKNNYIKYYSLGELEYQDMIIELKNAERFIFLEFFMINFGQMWEEILCILEEKVKSGVDVRIIYDDLGCISKLPRSYPKFLESKGIKCISFNRVGILLGSVMKNRDHRKILVIDGVVAFSGGLNLSDEYININSKLGEWKDTGTCVRGDAVWNYTVMFLEMWNSYRNDDEDFRKFKVNFSGKYRDNGYVVAYGENPLDDEVISEDIYLNIINQAKEYVYIFTPYLIIDTDMLNSLVLAAKRGVDIRIILPGIPDRKMVYDLSFSYFDNLISGGVKIYTYTPGFMHAKVFISDDNVATVGSINLDYRSLYLHFECGMYMENVDSIKDIKNDVEESLKKSYQITREEAKPNLVKRVYQAILRFFAPLI